jgi:outer membrane protein assembly factor BamB
MSSTASSPTRRAVLLLGACVVLTATTAFGADWPQFRGPNRDDISRETGLLKSWPEGGPKLAWKVTGIGEGYAGVSVVAGKAYTMGEDSSSSYIRALDEATGKALWSAKVGPIGGGQNYPGPRCTPAVDGNLVVALGQHGDLVAVDAATGKELWRTHLVNELGGGMMSGWGYSESPLIDGDKVICTPGGAKGTLAALDRKTGKVLWRSTDWTDKAAYASIVPATIHGVKQYVQLTGDARSGESRGERKPGEKKGERKGGDRGGEGGSVPGSIAGVDAATGKLLWKAPRTGRTAVIPTPIVSGDLVYVTSGYANGCNLFRIEKSGAGFTATQVYAKKDITNQHGGVVQLGDLVFGFSDSNGWLWQNLKTGDIVQTWPQKEFGKGAVSCADGLLYLRLERDKGTVVLLDPSTDGVKVRGRFDQPDRSKKNSWPHPVVANGRLYLRDQDVLLAYDVKQK